MNEPEVKENQIRRETRFKPESGVYAFVDARPNARKFMPNYAGLVINQSYKGCSIVVIPEATPELGSLIKVKLGPLAPILAEIRWFEKLDKDGVYKLGLLFMQ